MAAAGFQVIGLDFSKVAIAHVESKVIPNAKFVQADMAQLLPLEDASIDAVFSNLALHMFDHPTTRRIVSEVRRILKAGGRFIVHVNSTGDRELRATRKTVVEDLGDNVIRERDGQTVHFFSEEDLKSLFQDWQALDLVHLEIPHRETGLPFKRVWRGVATA